MKAVTTTNLITSSSTTILKVIGANKETGLSKVLCFKCQGFGHYQNTFPNRRVMTLREDVEVRDELFEEEERLGNTFILEEDCEVEEEEEKYEAPLYDTMLLIRTLLT